MALAIVTEVRNDNTKKFEAMARFRSFNTFYVWVLKFKAAPVPGRMRVRIPAGFEVTAEEVRKIEALGIVRA